MNGADGDSDRAAILGEARIWRPEVEIVGPKSGCRSDDAGPAAARLDRPAEGRQGAPLYTKTSLRYDRSKDPVYQLNCAIIDATQAYNNSARPFSRASQTDQPSVATTSLVSPTLHQEASVFTSQQQHQQHQRNQEQQEERHDQCTGDMSPQLMHKQYNSPIDLYSMNNIRKTIEARSELLAPGVKGINFMKADSPVNKQSEVYKLVKEEEEKALARPRPSGPAGSGGGGDGQVGRPLGERQVPNVSVLVEGSEPEIGLPQRQHAVQYAAEHGHSSGAASTGVSPQFGRGQVSPGGAVYQPAGCSQMMHTSGHEAGPQPKCCECGQSIVGPFAKLQNRFVHPHCFNCSTCGGSLKNSGYFTINDKLYCEIHARQVANVMRLNYNFEPNKQAIDNTRQQYDEPHKSRAKLEQQRQQQQQQQQALAVHHQKQYQQERQSDDRELVQSHQHNQSHSITMNDEPVGQIKSRPCANCCVTLKNQSATISTMFSNRSGASANANPCDSSTCSTCGCSRHGEIRWSWRPACAGGAPDRQPVLPPPPATSGAAVTSSTLSDSSNLRHFEQQQHQRLRHQQHQHQLVTRQKYESRLISSSASSSTRDTTKSSRMPVCCHCHIQIHGPYILAGDTTWCKPCSQTHFVCSSCQRSLLNVGFIEDTKIRNKYYCEHCFEIYLAPICSKCHIRIKDSDCLKALGKTWHPNCFVCGHCKCTFGNSSFYLEDNVPYCERDWNLLFTTKCSSCSYPIEAGDKWIEALDRNYHSDCFRCTACQVKLEGTTFYCKGDRPYCRMHAR